MNEFLHKECPWFLTITVLNKIYTLCWRKIERQCRRNVSFVNCHSNIVITKVFYLHLADVSPRQVCSLNTSLILQNVFCTCITTFNKIIRFDLHYSDLVYQQAPLFKDRFISFEFQQAPCLCGFKSIEYRRNGAVGQSGRLAYASLGVRIPAATDLSRKNFVVTAQLPNALQQV